jgi:3-methyladenine DNA glycosylase AlkD
VKAEQARIALRSLGNAAKARVLQGFFKTGKGQYGEGDLFLGVTVPQQRALAERFVTLPLSEISRLLHSKIHEERLTAIIILGMQYSAGNESQKKSRFNFYLKNIQWVNNWDLVDCSAHVIVGDWLLRRDRSLLYRMAKSNFLWERRVAMVATYRFICAGETKDAFALAALLRHDTQDLMHKAAGWMLREAGKRVSEDRLRAFLKKNAARLPRTALRYAIERFGAAERKRWLRAS